MEEPAPTHRGGRCIDWGILFGARARLAVLADMWGDHYTLEWRIPRLGVPQARALRLIATEGYCKPEGLEEQAWARRRQEEGDDSSHGSHRKASPHRAAWGAGRAHPATKANGAANPRGAARGS